MENQTQTLQDRINERAIDNLRQDISKFLRDNQNSPLYHALGEFKINVGTSEKPQVISLSELICFRNNGFEKFLLDYLSPKYIERETEAFMKTVEELKAQVDNLFNEKNEEYR